MGIVEKVQETSSGTGMHNRTITMLHVNVSWKTETCPQLVSVLIYSPSPQAIETVTSTLYMYENVHNLHMNIAKGRI